MSVVESRPDFSRPLCRNVPQRSSAWEQMRYRLNEWPVLAQQDVLRRGTDRQESPNVGHFDQVPTRQVRAIDDQAKAC